MILPVDISQTKQYPAHLLVATTTADVGEVAAAAACLLLRRATVAAI
jgi:hypothetical protein